MTISLTVKLMNKGWIRYLIGGCFRLSLIWRQEAQTNQCARNHAKNLSDLSQQIKLADRSYFMIAGSEYDGTWVANELMGFVDIRNLSYRL